MHFLLQVIPPGMEFHHIIPHDGDMDAEPEPNEDGKSPDPPIWTEVRIESAIWRTVSEIYVL